MKNVKIVGPYFNFKCFQLSRLIFLSSVKAEPHSTFQYLKEPAGKPEGDSVRNYTDKKRSNGHELEEGKFRLDVRNLLL